MCLLSLGLMASSCGEQYQGDDDDSASDDDDDDVADDDDTSGPGPDISSVSPSSGGLAGNYTINVYGANFTDESDTTIYFNDAQLELLGCGPAQCTAMVPVAGNEGSVTVRMFNSNGEDSLENGFTYVEDMSGLTSYFAIMDRVEYLYPDIYKPPPTSEFYIQVGFCDMVDLNNSEGVSAAFLDGGESVTLSGLETDYEIPLDDYYYLLEGMDIFTDYVAGDYTLLIDGGDDLNPEQVEDCVTAPEAVTVAPPLQAEYVSLATFQAGSEITVTGTCDKSIVRIDIYPEASGYSYDQSILCHYAGAGTLALPATYTANVSGASILVVNVACTNVTTNIIASGAQMTGIGRHLASGAIIAY
jgi:expansin (peptidoglycan-binding protein)